MEEDNQQQTDKVIEYGPAAIVAGDVSKSAKQPGGSKLDFLKKKPVIIALVALLLVGGAVAAYFLTRDSKADQSNSTNNRSATMGVLPTLIDGAATYKSGAADWQPLTTDTQLVEGMFISTDVGSRVVLTFDDGSALRMDESTVIQLTSLLADSVQVDQTSGTVYSRVVESERTYTVNVGETGYTALGTAFTTISKPADKGVQVLQSSVKVGDQDESVAEGKQFFKDHSNAELKDKQTDINLDELKSNGFMLWNLEQDEQSDLFKEKLGLWEKVKQQTGTPEEQAPPSSSGIKLSASNNEKGTVLTWTVSGVDAPNGFKVVRSKKSSTPTFGKDEAAYIDSSKARSYTWKSDSEGTFWYRVCVYRPDQGTCDNYSNAVQMQAVYVAPEKVVRGGVVLSGPGEENLISWTMTGTAPYGYKIVVSTEHDPIYPDDAVDLTGSTSYQLKSEQLSTGTNYVRVCKYTSGSEAEKCVDYSNEIIVIKS